MGFIQKKFQVFLAEKLPFNSNCQLTKTQASFCHSRQGGNPEKVRARETKA
jgi:hypothetical protein